MNQPVRIYPTGSNNIELFQKGNQLNITPHMKRKLQPIADSGTFMQSPTQKNTSSPLKGRVAIKKMQSMEVEKETQPNDKERLEIKLSNLKKNIRSQQSESFSPTKKPGYDAQKIIMKTQQSHSEFIKGLLPTLNQEATSPQIRRVGTPKRPDSKNFNIMDKSEIAKIFSQEERFKTTKVKNEFLTHRLNTQPSRSNNLDSSKSIVKTEKSDSPMVVRPKNQKFNPERSSAIVNQDRSLMKQSQNQLGPRSSSNPSLVKQTLQDEEDTGVSIIRFVVQKSQAGLTSNKQQKVNQDSLFCNQGFCGFKNRHYLGACDGHGVFGHYVSQIIKKILPQNMETYLKQFVTKSPNNELGPKEEAQVLRSFAAAFTKTTKEINTCGVDVTFSGTTCVTVLVSGTHVWCANIGDSRAVVFFQKDGAWNIQPLSNDHKPDLPNEKKRILQHKGRVEPYYSPEGQPIGPHRVWLMNEQIPGLAMSRSFGDYIASTVGVVSDPEVTYFKVEFSKGFMVIASDGVWEFLSNERVCEIIQLCIQDCSLVTNQIMDNIATNLIKESTKCWQEEDEVVDDISCIVAYLCT